jgi:ParB-like chromosome segregation protein Spo0J
MAGEDFSNLVASVKKLGRLRYPVIVHDGMILDGRHRLKACKIAKVEPKWIVFNGTDQEALEVAWDLNYNRRHQNESQRAVAAAMYFTLADVGRPEKCGASTTLNEAADKAHVGKTTMQLAKKVVEHGTKKDIESIKSGKTTVKQVASRIQSESKNGSEDVDASGFPIPKPAQEYWHRRKEAADILAQLRYAKTKIRELKPEDIMWAEVNLGGVTSDLESAINRFRGGMPAHVCAHCQGQHPERCTACKGRGVVSEYFWRQCVPVELREMREQRGKAIK